MAGENTRLQIIMREEFFRDERVIKDIGTYKEKRLHRILKRFYEPNEDLHEIPIGNYIADVLRENEIVEIQTGSFYPMKDKIRYYLEETEYSVTIVRPLAHIKWCVWIDPSSGEVVSKRRSPKKTLPKDVLRDWYYLSEFVENKRLKIVFLLMEMEEYRTLDGWSKNRKKGSHRCELIPINIVDEQIFCDPLDYLVFLPENLQESFTAAEYMKASGIGSYSAYSALNILCSLGFIEKSQEKKGRSKLYFRSH